MAEAYRRVFLKPVGLGDADAARLEEQLDAAVQLQHRLSARSPHVLQPVGGLQHEAEFFYVEHEPAQPMPAEGLFDLGAPFADEGTLLRAGVALFDALRVGHERAEGRAVAHGGLSPAVLLEADDGALKISDFGIAPAFCAVLGPEHYVQLAVACDERSRSEHGATGIWEVLSSEEYDRDDRICGYIDPEKFGTQTLASFEPGSDVISAGLILHLLAEHRHPYIEDVEDLRIVELAESMAARIYTDAWRDVLHESHDPAMRRWCELVAATLARLPRDRPSAASLTASLAEVGAKPMGVEDVLAQRLEHADELAKKGEWRHVRDLVVGVAASPDAPTDIVARAKKLLRQAETYAWLDDAAAQLDRESWSAAKGTLKKLSSTQVPADVANEAAKLRIRLDANLKALDLLDGIERTFKDATQSDPAQAGALADRLLADIDALPEDDEIGASVRDRRQAVRDKLARQRDELKTKAETRAAEFAIVNKWSDELRNAWSREHWLDVETLLADRPTAEQWPRAVRAEANRFERLLPQVLDAAAWIENLRAAVELNDARETRKQLDKKPSLSDWPATLRNDLAELEGRADAAKRKIEEAEAAERWIGIVAKAVEKEDWPTAQSALGAKPHLQEWSADVAEREADFRTRIGEQLEARDRDRLMIDSWLQTAERAAGEEQWEEALRILDTPPLEANRLPKAARNEQKARQKTYATALEATRNQAAGKRDTAAETAVRTLLNTVLDKDLHGLIAEEALDIRYGEVAWDTPESPTRGTLSLRVVVTAAAGNADDNTIVEEIDVEVHGSRIRIADEGSIRSNLAVQLQSTLKKTQEQRAGDIVSQLRDGLFPKAEARIRLDSTTDRFATSISLLGGSTPKGRIKAEFEWNPQKLLWSNTDPAGFAHEAIALAVETSCAGLKAKLFEKSDLLRRYASVLAINWDEPAIPADGTLPTSLTLDGRLLLSPEGSVEPQLLIPLPVSIENAGGASLKVDAKSAEDACLKALLAAQEAARARLERRLQAKAKSSPGKPRVTALGKAIKVPIPKTEFECRPRRGAHIQVAADWDASAFDFALADKTKHTLAAFLEGLAPSSGGVRGRPVFIISGAAAAIVLVVGASMFWPNSSDADRSDLPTGTGNQPAATTDGGGAQPALNGAGDPAIPPTTDAPQPRTMDEALAEVRSLFDGTRLEGFAPQLVSEAPADAEGTPRATVIFPGLATADAELTVALDLDGAAPTLSEADAQVVKDGTLSVEALLDDSVMSVRNAINAETFVGAVCDTWVNCRSLDVASDAAQTDWSLNVEQRTWSITDFPARAVVGTDGIILFDQSLTLRVADGAALALPPGAADGITPTELTISLRALVAGKIVELQTTDLAQRSAELARSELAVTIDPPNFTEPLSALTFNVTSPGLKDRSLDLTWNRASLEFESDGQPWIAQLDQINEAVDTLAVITSALADPQHWIRRVSEGSPYESSEADAVNLEFSVPAPWKPDVTLPIYSARYGSRSVGDSQPINPPLYWSVVERYLQLAGAALSVSQPENVRSFAADLQADASLAPAIKQPLAAYFGSTPPPAHVLPLASIDANAVPSFLPANPLDANPNLLIEMTMRMAVDTQSPANQTIEGVNLQDLDRAVADLTASSGAAPPTCTLAIGLDADDPSKTTLRWSKLSGVGGAIAADIGGFSRLDQLLNGHADRVTLEAELDNLLTPATDGFVQLNPNDVLAIVDKIWAIKGAVPQQPAPQTLDELSTKLKNDIKFATKTPRVTPRLQPTVFAEYFTGPQRTFAVVWSASHSGSSGPATVEGQPTLVRLGDNASFVSDPSATDLAARLLKPVLDRVPGAVDAGYLGPFNNRLGVALALDPRLPLTSIASIVERPIHNWESDLEPAQNAGGLSGFTPWNSLKSLQDSDRAAGYTLRNALFSRQAWQASDTGQTWAIQTLDAALIP